MYKAQKIWLIGGSSGIGLALAEILLQKQNSLIVSSRNASINNELLRLKEQHPSNLQLLDFDLFFLEEAHEKVDEAWKIFNGLDLWFYNAGAYEVMDIENWDSKKFIDMNSINYLAPVHLMTLLLPYFKKQKSGKWIWNLSLSTYFGLPKGGGYSAPKAALLNLAESIQPELKQFNIVIQIINHGFVKTRLTAKNDFEMPQLMSCETAAQEIYKRMETSDNFEIRFPLKLSLFLRFLSLLPYKISLAITQRML